MSSSENWIQNHCVFSRFATAPQPPPGNLNYLKLRIKLEKKLNKFKTTHKIQILKEILFTTSFRHPH